jgi:1D-myo-inositol 3-kinase
VGGEVCAGQVDLVIVGPATRDLLPGGGWRLGGTVLYGAATASRLGLRVGVVTCGPADVVEALRAAVPAALVAARLSPHATTFENVYEASGARTQYLRARSGDPLGADDVPEAWRRSGHVLVAPLARDVDPAVIAAFPVETRIAATPQGWLRQWDEAGRVSPARWTEAAAVLPRIEALILSDEDLFGSEAARGTLAPGGAASAGWLERDSQLLAWRAAGALVAVTRGERGAMLYTRTSQESFPAFPVLAVNPTGAGDVFAAALLRAWWWGSDIRSAMRFANATASFVVERAGIDGLPAYAEVSARLNGAPPYFC